MSILISSSLISSSEDWILLMRILISGLSLFADSLCMNFSSSFNLLFNFFFSSSSLIISESQLIKLEQSSLFLIMISIFASDQLLMDSCSLKYRLRKASAQCSSVSITTSLLPPQLKDTSTSLKLT